MLSYVLPLRVQAPAHELTDYLTWLSTRCEVIVVDGSSPKVFACHARMWPSVQHVAVDRDLVSPMGKVGGVLTGLARASHRGVVIADDDVRHTVPTLTAIERLLTDADVVIPQNYFARLPWHARWDTARSLIARSTGGDWPGTLGVNRDLLCSIGGYRGDVMFENLELVRTVQAAGGRVERALDLFVARLPPTTRQFRSQRVRQAYDELARPGRLIVELAVLPLAVAGGRRAILLAAIASVMLAEVGRRRHNGQSVFSATSALWAPAWVTERACTAWIALVQRAVGGVAYGGHRIRTAASSPHRLRRLVHP